MKVTIRKHTTMAALGAPDIRYFEVYIDGENCGSITTRTLADKAALRSKLLTAGFEVIDLTNDDDESSLTQAV